MKRTLLAGTTGTLLGSLATGVALFAVVAYFNRGTGFSFCTATTGLGWTVPLITGLLIAGVVVLLLGSAEDTTEAPPELRSSTCSACGTSIIDEWRMCPHCGELLECDVAMPGATSE